MRLFTRSAPPSPTVVVQPPRTLDEQVDELAAELVERAYARAARSRVLDVMQREDLAELPTSVLLMIHLDDVAGGQP